LVGIEAHESRTLGAAEVALVEGVVVFAREFAGCACAARANAGEVVRTAEFFAALASLAVGVDVGNGEFSASGDGIERFEDQIDAAPFRVTIGDARVVEEGSAGVQREAEQIVVGTPKAKLIAFGTRH